MKKVIALITIASLLMLGILNVILAIKDNKNRTVLDINDPKLAIMVQQEEGKDNYVPWNNDTWPTDDYELNTGKSKCDNNSNSNGNISFDSTKGIIIDTNKSDRCTIFFDKAAAATLHAVKIDDDFSQYCRIEIDNGSGWKPIEFPTNPGETIKLEPGTKIQIYAIDDYGIDNQCGINICETSDCDSGDYSLSKCAIYDVNSQRHGIYTAVKGNYYYSLAYCYCLTGDNEIWVEEKKKRKKKKIFELKKGHKILTIDEKTGKIEARKVKEIRISKVNVICKITLDNNEVIRASMKHIFVEENLGDVMSDELKVGYRLQDALGNYHEITNIEIENYSEGIEVYTIIPEESDKVKRLIISSLILTGAFGSNVMLVYAVDPCSVQ